MGNSNGANGGNRPPTLDRLKKKEASTAKVLITMSASVAEDLEDAENDLAMIQMRKMQGEEGPEFAAETKAAEEKVRIAKDAAKEDAVEFVFRSVGRKAYDNIVTQNPPTDENRKEVEAQGGDPKTIQWNPYTFPQALVAASMIHPHMSEEEVVELWDSPEWGGNELQQLFYAALAVQQKNRVVQLGNA